MAVYRWGTGTPVVLVHGITTYSFIWRRIAPELAMSRDVYSVDLAGCGAADLSANLDLSLPAHTARLHALVDELGLERFHLIGHDVGGGIAQRYAVSHPDRLLSATFINSVGYQHWPVQPISALRAPILRQIAIATVDSGLLTLLIKRVVHDKQKVTKELLDLYSAPLRTRIGRKALLRFANALDNQHLVEISEDLKTLDVPCLVVRGDQDRYLNAEITRRLGKDLPNARVEHFPDAGHLIQEDCPDELLTCLLGFLSSVENN